MISFDWTGTARQFRSALNKVGIEYGITFKGDVGKSVDFLDCTIMLHTVQVDIFQQRCMLKTNRCCQISKPT